MYRSNNQCLCPVTINSAGIQTKLMATVQIFSKGQLGFGPMEIGAHSLRSGAAMAMYLIGVSALTIMIIRIWQSDAFLLYICKQVAHFTNKVSDKIIQNKEFFTVPDFYRTIQEATNGAFLIPLSNPDMDKENCLPRALGTWKLVSMRKKNLHQYMRKLADRGRLGSGIRN